MDLEQNPEQHLPKNESQETQSSSVEELKRRLEIYELFSTAFTTGPW